MDWMLMPLRKYAQFSGRSQRKEFWMWVLFLVIVNIVAAVIDRLLGFGRTTVVTTPTFTSAASQTYGPVRGLLLLATLLPNLSVSVRRLHDIDRTGWWVVAPLIPYAIGGALMITALVKASAGNSNVGGLAAGGIFFLIGAILAIVLLVFYCLDGTKGTNRFGPDPKGSIPDLAERFS